MKTANEKRKAFRENLRTGRFMIAPGIYDALSAKAAEAAGLPCLAMGGYAISASRLGEPDVGLLSLSEMTEALKQICDATDIPVIGDGDTGYGNALNVIRTEQEYEKAGAEALFIEALRDRDEVERIAREFEGTGVHLFANMIEGGKTPIIPARELQAMGYAGVFWSCASLYMVTKTLFDNFSTLAREGTSESFLDDLIPFADFNRFIGLDKYRELEKKYGVERQG